MGCISDPMAFPLPDRHLSATALQNHSGLVWIQTSAGQTLAVLVQPPRDTVFTVLFFHGNAEDLGFCLGHLLRIVELCNARVFCVEYPGYSISVAAKPTEALCYEAAEAGFQYLCREWRIAAGTVVPFGQSVGSGPAVHLAAAHPEIRALVLQSPLESGARVACCKCAGYVHDKFTNYRKIGKVEARTCIIHGTEDEVVPYAHGRRLYETLEQRGKAAKPLWMRGRGHNDMDEEQVLRHVRSFLEEMASLLDRE